MTDVFISYCRKDQIYLDRLLECWSERSLQPWQKWKQELQIALDRARIAILLVTPFFLASRFIRQHKLLRFLARAEVGTLTPVHNPIRYVDVTTSFMTPRTKAKSKQKVSLFLSPSVAMTGCHGMPD